MHDVMTLRVYYCPDVAALTEEAARGVLRAALQGCIDAEETPPAAMLVPVTAVGTTPSVCAGIHIVMMAMRVAPS